MIYLDFSWAVGIFFLVLVGVVFLSWILSRNKKDKKLTLVPMSSVIKKKSSSMSLAHIGLDQSPSQQLE